MILFGYNCITGLEFWEISTPKKDIADLERSKKKRKSKNSNFIKSNF